MGRRKRQIPLHPSMETNPVNAAPECLACGVCCFSPSDQYIWVNGADWTLLGTDAERLAHFIGNRAFMKMQDGHCAALEIRREAGQRPVFFCTIYEKRPIICHALGRGSPECAAVLEEPDPPTYPPRA
jgi:Fe-S-cluster containining protein